MTSNAIAIVTGAGSGIGRATTEALLALDFTVIAVGRTAARLEALAEACGPRVVPCAADVGDPAQVARVFDAVDAAGTLSLLVNNAGVGYAFEQTAPGSMAALADTPEDLWREVMRINLDSVYHVCRPALSRFFDAGGGSIVNVASVGGLQGMADAHTYSAAKAGMVNLTRSLARTYGPRNVRSNVVAPGFVATEMVAPVLASDRNPFADEAMRYAVSPLGRPGQAEEIADGIVYLGVRASYCNGTVLVIDGGSSA